MWPFGKWFQKLKIVLELIAVSGQSACSLVANPALSCCYFLLACGYLSRNPATGLLHPLASGSYGNRGIGVWQTCLRLHRQSTVHSTHLISQVFIWSESPQMSIFSYFCTVWSENLLNADWIWDAMSCITWAVKQSNIDQCCNFSLLVYFLLLSLYAIVFSAMSLLLFRFHPVVLTLALHSLVQLSIYLSLEL